MPASALWVPARIESFCWRWRWRWRIEQQIGEGGEGGFALALGDPGSGKSAGLRILTERLSSIRDLSIGVLIESGIYYARLRIAGKQTWRTLGTEILSVAPHELTAILQEEKRRSEIAGPGTSSWANVGEMMNSRPCTRRAHRLMPVSIGGSCTGLLTIPASGSLTYSVGAFDR